MLRIRNCAPTEKRLDCVDPHRMYVKFPDRWVLATTVESMRLSGREDLFKLFELLTDSTVRSGNAQIRMEARLERTRRLEEANAAAESVSHLLPMVVQDGSEKSDEKSPTLNWSESGDVLPPFETEELA
jgi:hypothetical protein